jgi:hypothetical protein
MIPSSNYPIIELSNPRARYAHPGLTRVGLAALLEEILNIFAKLRDFLGMGNCDYGY